MSTEPLSTEPLSTEPLSTEPLGTEPLGTEGAHRERRGIAAQEVHQALATDEVLTNALPGFADGEDSVEALADLATGAGEAVDDTTDYDTRLAVSFADLAKELHLEPALDAIVERVVEVALKVVDGCESASVTLLAAKGRKATSRKLATAAATSESARAADAAQLACDEGPSIDAIGEAMVEARDETWGRWPALAPAAQALGVRTIASFGLIIGSGADELRLGTLNLYSGTANAFDTESLEVGYVLAAHAAVAISAEAQKDRAKRKEAALRQAIETRDVIGQAKGILMERQHLGAEEAFAVLRRASQRMNVKLTEVAEDVTRSVASDR